MKNFLFAVIFFGVVSAQASTKLVLTGSSTVAPLMMEISKRFEAKVSGTRVDIQTGGSSRGIADATNGVADIGMISRPLKPSEAKLGLESFTIASDGVGFIVHASNTVTNLTTPQASKIMRGEITNWKDVGGQDAKIIFVNRADGRSEVELVTKHFSMKTTDFKASSIVGENAHGIKTIANNPHAITYLSIGSSEAESELGTPIKLLALDGVQASVANVRNGSFAMARPLNLVLKSTSPLRAQLIEFASSQEVYDLVKEQFFVPLKD